MAKRGAGNQIDNLTPTTKSQESPRFLCVQVACDILVESSRQRLHLCYKLHFNQRFANKIMGPQSRRNPNFGNFETPTWESRDKCHLGANHMARHRIYYKGEGGGFPQVRTVVNLVSPSLPMVHLAPKVLQLYIDQLIVWLVQVCVSEWLLVILPSLILEL
jgi:hypothetical protein